LQDKCNELALEPVGERAFRQEEIMATLSLSVGSIAGPAAPWRAGLGILAVLAGALAIGLTTLVNVDSDRAWYAAAENVLRFSSFVFLIFLFYESASTFAPSAVPGFDRIKATLLFAFAGAYAAYLAFIVGRVYFANTHGPGETLMFCAFAGVVPAVLAVGTHRHRAHSLGWEILRRAAIVYFWLIFALSGLGHFYGPHRPDRYFGTLLLLLLAALLLRLTAGLAGTLSRQARHRGASDPFGVDSESSRKHRVQQSITIIGPPTGPTQMKFPFILTREGEKRIQANEFRKNCGFTQKVHPGARQS
jgi:hypothetical protein